MCTAPEICGTIRSASLTVYLFVSFPLHRSNILDCCVYIQQFHQRAVSRVRPGTGLVLKPPGQWIASESFHSEAS
jgi:hypothetical protein